MGNCDAWGALSGFWRDRIVDYEREVIGPHLHDNWRALLTVLQICRAVRIAALCTVRTYFFSFAAVIERDIECCDTEARV